MESIIIQNVSLVPGTKGKPVVNSVIFDKESNDWKYWKRTYGNAWPDKFVDHLLSKYDYSIVDKGRAVHILNNSMQVLIYMIDLGIWKEGKYGYLDHVNKIYGGADGSG